MATENPVSTKPKHIMMSYAWAGTQDLVYEVAEQLKNENIPVWMDIRNGVGGKINDGLAKAVEDSIAVCFFMTPEYQASKNCRKELEYADTLEKPLIPCRCRGDFKPSGWLGLISSGMMWFDFRDLSDQPVNGTMNKLINYIQTDIFKVQATVFPDLEGRTLPMIFRNRQQFRAPHEISDTPIIVDSDHEQSLVRGREQPSSPTINRSDSQLYNAFVVSGKDPIFVDLGDEKYSHRFTSLDDPDDDLTKMGTPIMGYEELPLLPLEKTVIPLEAFLGHDIQRYVYIAKQNTREPTLGLTNDESASIHLYTMEWSSPSRSLYSHLNRALRTKNREGLKPWFSYLKLFLTALFKLPSQSMTVWRGIKADLHAQYTKGQYITWWGLSSCTASIEVLESEMFVGKIGIRTLFSIETSNAKYIREHSYFKTEDEILLLPGTYLKVVGKFSPAQNLTIIQLQEQTPPFCFIEPPFLPESEQKSASVGSSRTSQRESQPTRTTSTPPGKKQNHQPHRSLSKNKPKSLMKKK